MSKSLSFSHSHGYVYLMIKWYKRQNSDVADSFLPERYTFSPLLPNPFYLTFLSRKCINLCLRISWVWVCLLKNR